ncbi:exopolyphosphatase [Xanthomonadaceae bacterium JHOS43]|nr:exopolyphosphatase [Xanthomonadaceae bacterium JHOS43]MCX7563949.1 exopolyphosphatase [Xanthomonadaceae bacterium XH05]
MSMTDTALRDGELMAAIDIGSNSFHMVVARNVLGQLRIVDRLRETVRIASGLRGNGDLDPAARERALICLARFGERIHSLPSNRVRAIATNTVRQLRNPAAFLIPAETALGHGIEVVSGREEARLIYLGVAHGMPPTDARRLVIDIGGGSTEFIIGSGFQPLERESLQMGCIATTRRFFPDGKLSRKRWQAGKLELALQFQQFTTPYRALGWQETIGSSGTAKAISEMLSSPDLPAGTITRDGLDAACDRILDFKHIDDIRLDGISADRRPIIAGGLLVMQTCFHELDLERMRVCETAMREGVLHDMLGRAQQRDPRDAAIAALAIRYGVDAEHAQRVEDTALMLFDQIAESWELEPDDRLMLTWAARLHELGLAISHSQHQKHGAYVVANSDIDGFSRQEQSVLAALVRCQRRSISHGMLATLPGRMAHAALRNIVLLRLAILLHRSHDRSPPPPMRLCANGDDVHLKLPETWLASHALTHADLATERDELAAIGLDFSVGALD